MNKIFKTSMFIGFLALLLGVLPSISSANSTIYGSGNTSITTAYFCLTNGCFDVNGAPVTVIIYNDAAPNDLSSSFANINGTIYNKSTETGYSTPKDFFADSGVSSFNGLIFDTSWKPGTPVADNVKPTINVTPTSSPAPTPSGTVIVTPSDTTPPKLLGLSYSTYAGGAMGYIPSEFANLSGSSLSKDLTDRFTQYSIGNDAKLYGISFATNEPTRGTIFFYPNSTFNTLDNQLPTPITAAFSNLDTVHNILYTSVPLEAGTKYLVKIDLQDASGNLTHISSPEVNIIAAWNLF